MITQSQIKEIQQHPELFRLLRLNPFESTTVINGDNIEFSPLILRKELIGDKDNKKLVVLDTETTGIDHKKDEIIELSFVVATYNYREMVFVSIDDVYDSFNEPAQPITKMITDITGISNEMVKGKKITFNDFKDKLPEKYLIVAHNAGFDRKFVEKTFPEMIDTCWADSLTEIDWKSKGYAKNSLEMLMTYLGMFYNAHRAVNDCLALIAVISCSNSLAELINNASKRSLEVVLCTSFDDKDYVKELGFKWRGADKTWVKNYKDVTEWESDKQHLNNLNVWYHIKTEKELTSLTRYKE